uniref:Calmodulin n=1 Tax=Hyaloperonospora arabidopsidis (strain Emoy2) TaxID=559515 RepID=M4B9Y8_HYAAE
MNPPSRGTQQVPLLHTWVPPSPQEQQLYDCLFAQVDDQRRNVIGGQQAVAFFSRSHLDKTVLREIWNVADGRRQSALSRHEFYVAMRLISMAQHGEQVSVQSFYCFAMQTYPLPMIEGVSLPQGVQNVQNVQQQQQLPTQVQVQAQAHVQHSPRKLEPKGHPQQLSSNGDAFAPTADEMSKYQLVFQKYDTDHDGFLNGAEAVALFQLSGLNRNVLRDIWTMADVTRDSKLNTEEFYVAMHLIVCVTKRGLQMPPTLPPELEQAAFGTHSASATMSVQYSGFQGTVSASKSVLMEEQQESVPLSKLQGMCAFDSFSTSEDAPLPSLISPPSPCGSRKDVFIQANANGRNVQIAGFDRPLSSSPSGGLYGDIPTPSERQECNSFSTTPTPSVITRDCTNSASSMNSMSSFGDFSSLPAQQFPQPSLHNISGNERTQMHVGNPGYQAHPELAVGGGFGAPRCLLEKEFMSDEEEKRLARQLDQQNRDFAQIVADMESKLSTIETISSALGSLHETRNELVALVMKRDEMRAASTCALASNGGSTGEKSWHAVVRSLESLVENQKQLVWQLQSDISRDESELEEAILSAQLQQNMSLGSQSPLIAAASPPLTTHTTSGAADSDPSTFASAALAFDEPSGVSPPVVVSSAPSVSTSSHGATDSSGFNAFSNFESAPSPAAAVPATILSETPDHLSPSQSASRDSTFNAFGDCAASPSTGAVPPLLLDFGGDSLFDSASLPVVVSESAEFGDFNAAATLSAGAENVSPSPLAVADTSFAPFHPSPSPSPAAIAFTGFDDFGATPSSITPVAAAKGASDSPIFSSEPTPFFGTNPTTPARDPSGATENPVFGAFPTTPLCKADATTSASTAVKTRDLIFAPVAADENNPDMFDDFGDVATSVGNAVGVAEPAAFELQPPENLLYPSPPSSVAATLSSNVCTTFPEAIESVESAPTLGESTGNSPFSSTVLDSNGSNGLGDLDGFGDFNTAPASIDDTAPLSAPATPAELISSNSLFSLGDETNSGEGCEDISIAPASIEATTTLFESMESNVVNEQSPVSVDNKKLGDFVDVNLAPVAADSASSPLSPVNDDGFEVIDDFVAAPILATNEKAMDAIGCNSEA